MMPMSTVTRTRDPRRGAALILALLVSIAIAAMAMGAIMAASGAGITSKFSAREAAMQAAANGGLEIIRDSVNHGNFDSLLPLDGYTTLEENVPVLDAFGNALPRTTRSLYVGRTGGRTGGAATAGQYGSNFASALSVIRDQRGAVAARRLLMSQESWSKFAVAINKWPGSAVYGCNESINGPFHSNDALKLMGSCNPKIVFAGAATVVGSVQNESSGNFTAGIKKGVAPIEWPTPAKIALMKQFAADGDAAGGDYDLTSRTSGDDVPGLRIEFLTIDADGNGTIEWNEGYMRVWVPANTRDSVMAYATARRWPRVQSPAPTGVSSSTDPNIVSHNCGATITLNGHSRWYSAREIYDSVDASSGMDREDARDGVRWALRGGSGTRPSVISNVTPTNRRCFLGGDPMLYPSTAGTDITPDSLLTNTPLASNNFGWWQKRRTGPFAAVASRSDAAYLIPLGANPNFKGVIYVNGDVAISGRLRGRVSVFATGNIVFVDDMLYHTPPGTNCESDGDIFGAIATINAIIADNSIQTPFKVNSTVTGGFDDTPKDEQLNMFIMAAGTTSSGTGNFVTQGVMSGAPGGSPPYTIGSSTGEACGGAPAGCVRVTGGISMGRVEYATYNGSTWGYAEAHAYDKCGQVNPPPYFPTTGRFIENRYYEIDPVWLNDKGIEAYFAEIRAQ
jgi:hypothetical protein